MPVTDPSLPKLPRRDPRGHKGTFGTVGIVGGDAGAPDRPRMIGAVALAGTAALRAGCGLVRACTPEPVLGPVLTLCPSATGIGLATDGAGCLIGHRAAESLALLLGAADVLIVGPGLGATGPVETVVYRATQQDDVPVVLDADGLNALARMSGDGEAMRAKAVLTPHPGEFARLASRMRIAADPTAMHTRPAAAEQLAQRLGCVVALKGWSTVVSDGQRTWTCTRGSPVLATAGTGDVLSGVIAGVIAQFVARQPVMIGPVEIPRPAEKPLDLYDATRLAVEAHAIAGERWAAEHHASGGMLATDLVDVLPTALEELRG